MVISISSIVYIETFPAFSQLFVLKTVINCLLINSSNWPWFCVEVLSRGSHRKYTKGNGQLLVAGKRLTLGVRGPGEKPSWGET